jgi:hypothetical protein
MSSFILFMVVLGLTVFVFGLDLHQKRQQFLTKR